MHFFIPLDKLGKKKGNTYLLSLIIVISNFSPVKYKIMWYIKKSRYVYYGHTRTRGQTESREKPLFSEKLFSAIAVNY